MNEYGTCQKCGTDQEMHYGIYCPKCYDCAPLQYRVFDFFKVLEWLDTERPGAKDRISSMFHGIHDQYMNDCGVSENIDAVLDEWLPHSAQLAESPELIEDYKLLKSKLKLKDNEEFLWWYSY